jgi:exopolyphosphatase / guanosine-5'-triphosphate,3'-diphosphate pyrophosphatase
MGLSHTSISLSFHFIVFAMRIAALDIGTNTALLLIAEVDGKSFSVLRDDHAIARLGEAVDRDRIIIESAYLRFRDILQRHAETIKSLNVDSIAAVGTSVFRDAQNRDQIVQRAKSDTGIEIEILSGDDEARWGCLGAIFGMSDVENAAVIDIGGGSTEISIVKEGNFVKGESIDIGAVRLTERFFKTNPIIPEDAEKARQIIRDCLNRSTESFSILKSIKDINTLVAVAGTPTTLAAMHLGLEFFDAAKVQNQILQQDDIDQLLNMLLKTGTTTLLQIFPAINKSRADILPAGTLILSEAMEYLGMDSIRVSTRGLRYGIALREIEHHDL